MIKASAYTIHVRKPHFDLLNLGVSHLSLQVPPCRRRKERGTERGKEGRERESEAREGKRERDGEIQTHTSKCKGEIEKERERDLPPRPFSTAPSS